MADWTFLLILLSFAAGGLFKGVTGIGLPLVALPLIAPRFGIPAAIAIITLPSIVTNFAQAWNLRAEYVRVPGLAVFLGVGLGGIVLGTLLMSKVAEASLSMALAGVIAAYLVLRMLRPDLVLQSALAERIAPAVGLAAGMVQGVTGIVAPVGVTYFNSMRLARPTFLFATSSMFLIFALVQFASVSFAGFMTMERLVYGGGGGVVAILAMPFGQKLGAKISTEMFDKLIICVLIVLSVRLLISALL